MIIDAHYHLDERMEPLDLLIRNMDREGIDKTALIAALVEPFVVTPLMDFFSGLMRKLLLGPLRPAGILFYNSIVTKAGRFQTPTKTCAIYQKPDNDPVAAAMKRYPDRFYGWIFINPDVHDPVLEIEARRKTQGWIGVKCHTFWHRYGVNRLDDTARCCVENNMPLLIHLGGKKEEGDFRYLPDRFPDLKIIYAHAGLPFFRELWDYGKNRENVWVDLSSPYLNERLRNEVVRVLGPDRCLFGSDGPFGYQDREGNYHHGAILREIERLPFSEREKERILSGNFLEITGLKE